MLKNGERLPTLFESCDGNHTPSMTDTSSIFRSLTWTIGPILVVATLIIVAAFTGRGPLSTETITFPIEVYPPDGTSEHVESITLTIDDASSVDSLYVQAHQISYVITGWEEGIGDGNFDVEGAASMRVNGGEWLDIRSENVDCAYPERVYECVGGVYPTIRFTVDADEWTLYDGTNDIEFRFHGTEGQRSGYRVLGLGAMTPGDPSIQNFDPFEDGAHDHGALEYVDYSSWSPPDGYDNSSDISAGEALWSEREILKELDGQDIKASCADCHATDGRDLKYFNYSNRTIEARSRGHGLSEEEGKQIAAYIRSVDLEKEDGTPYEAPGTPYNPPYQPGPDGFGPDGDQGPDEADPVYWAAGAGLDWVLDRQREEPDTERDMLAHLFPKNGDPAQGVDRTPAGDLNWRHASTDSVLTMRNQPLDIQFPDWNNWLPKVHPLEHYEDEYHAENVDDVYEQFDEATKTQNASTIWGDGITELGDATRDAFRRKGTVDGETDNMSAIIQWSGDAWKAVRMWESYHRNYVEDKADDNYCDHEVRPYCEPLGWVTRSRLPFDLAGHIVGISGQRSSPWVYQNEKAEHVFSHIWYQLAMTLNPTTEPRATGQSPIDWSYQRAHIRHTDREYGIPHDLRTVQTEIKFWQSASLSDNPGGDRRDWNAFVADIRPLQRARLDEDVRTAMMRAWHDRMKRYEPDEHWRDHDRGAWETEDNPPGFDQPDGLWEQGNRLYQWLIESSDAGLLAEGIVDSIATEFGEPMWPTTGEETDGPRWDEIVNIDPPDVGVLRPEDEATYTSPANLEITLDVSDDDNIDRYDFFLDGQRIDSREAGPPRYPWTNVPEGTYELVGKAITEDGTIGQSEALTVTVEDDEAAGEPGTQELILQEGWNLVSSRYAPDDFSLDDVLQEAMGDIVIVKDELGNAFFPDQNIDDIGLWNPFESYMIYSLSEQTIAVDGTSLRAEHTPISVREGWNQIPYLGAASMSVDDALESVLDEVVVVKDYAGNAYIPEYGIDDIGSFKPGQGYKLFATDETELTYPESDDEKQLAAARSDVTASSSRGVASSHTLIIEGDVIDEGELVTVWSEDGEKIDETAVEDGVARFTLPGQEGVDSNSGTIQDGTTLLIRTGDGTSTPLAVTNQRNLLSGESSQTSELTFESDAVTAATVSERPEEFDLKQSYPNPARSETTIEFSLTEESDVTLELYNALGQRVAILANGDRPPGVHEVSVDVAQFSSGTYFYRLRTDDNIASEQMVIVR